MADIQPGFTYSDVPGAPNNNLNAQNLHELVGNAIILPAFISAKTLKSPAALSDKIAIEDGGVLKYTAFQQLHDLILYPGAVVQTQHAAYTAFSNLTNEIPIDDTPPQNIEGTEILSVSITPRFATSTILCRFQGWMDSSVAVNNVAALFRGSLVDAIAASANYIVASGAVSPIALEYVDSPATTSPLIYSIRAGPGGTTNSVFNGTTATGRKFGGKAAATLVVQEIKQ